MDQIVKIPLLGGIDESIDPDQLPAPGMKELTNVVIRKKQRFQKREGYALLSTTSSPTAPATTYTALGSAPMPSIAESISGHRSQSGTKVLAAADGKLFEFVDQDANRGYRDINDIPMALGTIIPVDTSSGQGMEAQSCIIGPPDKKLRVTAWTVGERPAAIASDDSVWRKPTWDANGLYVAIQRDDTGAFISAPTRIKAFSGLDTTDVRNLRMCECYADNSGPNGEVSCIIAWQSGVGPSAGLEGLRVNSSGDIYATVDVFALCTAVTSGLPVTVAAFDIAQIWSSGIGIVPNLENNVAFAICTDDPQTPEVYWLQFNASASFGWSMTANAQALSGGTLGRTWTPRCLRGAMMQADKFNPDSKYTISARVGLSDSDDGATPIDMAIVTVLMEPAAAPGLWQPQVGVWSIVRDMNYQTMEEFTSIPGYAATGGKFYPSKTITQFNGNLQSDNTSTANARIVQSYRLMQQGPVLEANLLDGTSQIYAADIQYGGLRGNTQSIMRLSSVAPYIPIGLTEAELGLWTTSSRVSHRYPASMQIPVNLHDLAVYNCGQAVGATQLSEIRTPNNGPNNTFPLMPAGYYQGNAVQTAIVGAVTTTDAVADVVISSGIDITSITGTPFGVGLVNGTYPFTRVLIQGCSTALANVVVVGGIVTAVTVTDSGYGMTVGVAIPFSIPAHAMYPDSPEFLNIGTCNISNYASSIILTSCGVYSSPASYSRRFGACTGLAPLLGTLNAEVTLMQFETVANTTYAYTFIDGGDTTELGASSAFAMVPQNCVHRWSSCFSTGNDATAVVLAVSSTGANPYTTAAGSAPLSVPFVHSTNNYFETYKWMPVPGETLLRPRWPSGTTTNGISALAGPWRIVSDLTLLKRPDLATTLDFNKHRAVVAITPSGDDSQRSQYLVYIGDASNSMTVVAPTADELVSSTNWKYLNNKGMFVESINAPRVLSIPFGVSRIFTIERAGSSGDVRTIKACCGLIRDGSSQNTSSIGSLSYDLMAESWRQAMPYSDYTIVNGGVASLFDGSSCSEIAPMMWPQRSLCSISSADPTGRLFDMDKVYYSKTAQANTRSSLWPMGVGDGTQTVCALMNVSRPFFSNEAGLRDLNDSPGNEFPQYGGWSILSTSFGGKPTEDYQSISVDQRMTSYSLNSAVSGNTAPGGAKPVYFYGKYGNYAQSIIGTLQSGEEIASGGFVAWVPRNASEEVGGGKATVLSCSLSNVDTQGDMLMRFVYECADGTGRIIKSAPSVPSRYTVISKLLVDGRGNQVAVENFKYGFFAPRLELTNRLRSGADDNKRVTLQPYTTAEPFSSVFYRMPLQNWESPATAFTSERGSSRQLCEYESAEYAIGAAPYGFVTNNLTCFHGSNGEYLGILGMPYLYTTGGEYANTCPPSVRCMTTHQGRIIMGGADDPTVIWFSKEVTEQDAPSFSDLLTIQISDGGAVTGLGSLARALVVFKKSQIHVLTGDMPGSTATGASTASPWKTTLGEPHRLVDGLGCISPRSVISTPVGLFFQSNRTIEMMGQDMAVSPIGYRIMDVLETYSDVVSVAHKAVDSEVIFCCQKPSVLAGTNTDTDGSQAVLMVYNYLEDIWSKHTTSEFGLGNVTIGEQNDQTLLAVGGRTYRTNDTQFYDQTTNGDVWVTASGETAPIALNQGQGFQRVKRIRIMGDPIPALPASQLYQLHGMTLDVMTDWDSTQSSTWTETQAQSIYSLQGREFFEIHVRNQKCQKISLRFSDIQGSTLNTGYGVAFSSIALVVGVKSGLNKRMTMIAEH